MAGTRQLNDKFESKLDEINHAIDSNLLQEIGLMGGLSGQILFNYYLGICKNDSNQIGKALRLMSHLLYKLHTINKITLSYADGILGVATLLLHINSNNYLCEEYTIDSELIKTLYNKCVKAINDYQDDFLYGAGGYILFFILNYRCLPSETNKIYLCKIVDSLYERGKENNIFYSKCIYNFDFQTGIAHGYASWIILLSKIYSFNIKPELCLLMLNNVIQRYLPYLHRENCNDSYFPQVMMDVKNNFNQVIHSRLGWCNGDISVLYALLTYSETIKDNNLRSLIVTKFMNVAQRKNLPAYSVIDPTLCHGTAGIAHVFTKLYAKYKIVAFEEAADFWWTCTLNFSNETNFHSAGFVKKNYDKGEYIEVRDYGFLTGISGIGLAMLSYKYGITEWDELLLL